MESPGTLIRTARLRAGLTQQQLAARGATTQAAISRLERDGLSPTVATLERLLGATGERLRLASVRATAPRTLLTAGNPEWERLEVEKRQALRPAAGTPVAELLRKGIHLSRQAARLRRAVEGDDDPRP